MKKSYGCLITKEGDTYMGVFPDLNFTTSWGENFKEVIHKLKEAGELYCEDLEELPLKTSIEDLCEKYNHKALAVGIVLDLSRFNKLQDA